jgi:2-succinyl-5-enolpyruvyl-6-hydroxy-3-cyclohexene-1-carboxylate synthase
MILRLSSNITFCALAFFSYNEAMKTPARDPLSTPIPGRFACLDERNINSLWCSLVVEELIRHGVSTFCVSPGSRSAPLAAAVARHPEAETVLCYDERGAAFYALGHGRATGQPAVLICTSGTAAANYYPALIEASIDQVPMLVFSADRPPELLQTGANQTIRQSGMFGDYPRWQFDVPCPDTTIPPQMLLTTVDQAMHKACQTPAGPVHLNFHFREPLAPRPEPYDPLYVHSLYPWEQSQAPYTQHLKSVPSPDASVLKTLAAQLLNVRTGLLIVGRLASEQEREAVLALANTLHWPVFADLLSGLRTDTRVHTLVPHYDQLLHAQSFQDMCRPTTLLHVGEQPLSARLQRHLESYLPEQYIRVVNHSERRDPAHMVTHNLTCDVGQFCQRLQPLLKGESHINRVWVNTLQQKSLIVDAFLSEAIDQPETLTEPAVARLIPQLLPPQAGLFVASSMPVRDLDMYAECSREQLWIGANRGASGIDGTIASAVGFAHGRQQPTALLIGDLSCLHDLNSLMLLQSLEHPLVIVVVNNGGGGIFSFLPIAQHPEIFESHFGTPHSYTFAGAAKLFGLPYFASKTRHAFMEAYQLCFTQGHHALIEITTERESNLRFHRHLEQELRERLSKEP